MDPVSHAVIGRLIARSATTAASLPSGAGAAVALGALSPDADFVLMPAGWDIYLRAHEIGTHSAAGAIVMGLASAGVVRLLVRGSHYGVLAAAAVTGAISHVAADILSGATIRPAWPFATIATPVPLVAMADPWPIAILACGLLYLWRAKPAPGTGARRVLLALAAFFVVKAVLLGAALARSDPDAQWRTAEDRAVEAKWASLTEWHVYGRTGDTLNEWTIDARGGLPQAVLSVRVPEESELIAASRRLDTVRNFLHVHDLGFAAERPTPEGGHAVLWSDIRFCWRGPDSASALQCGLWFGGIYGPRGMLLAQQVRVGSWIQTRPPGS